MGRYKMPTGVREDLKKDREQSEAYKKTKDGKQSEADIQFKDRGQSEADIQLKDREQSEADRQPEDGEQLKKLRSACMRRCGLLLGSRDYSVSRLREKLLKAGFDDTIVEDSLERLKDAGYLDDRRYAEQFIRSHLSDKSRLRIIKDLIDRGIADEMISEAFGEFTEEEIQSAQYDQIRRLLEKRGYDPDLFSFEEKQKTMAFLQRKGFTNRLIRRAIEG